MPDIPTLTGGCLCGAIRYETSGKRRNSIVCHCRMCQRASGSPFSALFYMAQENIRLTKGKPAIYKSSAEAERHFCSNCGSPLFFQRLTRPDQRAIFVGSLDQPPDFKPDYVVCLSSSVNWLGTIGEAPQFEEKPDGMSPTLLYDPVTGHASERQG